MAKTSIILCAGAWHTKAHIEPVIPFFEKAGYRIVPHTMLSSGAHSNVFEDDVKAVQSTIETELLEGYNVVPIFHSFAGLSGVEAINNIISTAQPYNSKIQHIILQGSFLEIGPVAENFQRNNFLRIDTEKGVFWVEQAENAFYNDISMETAQPFIHALTSLAIYTTPAEVSSDLWQSAAPTTYLHCSQDNCVPSGIGEQTAEKYGMQLTRMNAGHCPFTTQPEKFVEVIDGILKQ